jgi:membrane protease YdiL (CAAX protease family)
MENQPTTQPQFSLPIQKRTIILIGISFSFVLAVLFSLEGGKLLLHLNGLSEITATVFFESRLFYWLIAGLLFLYTTSIEKLPLLYWTEKKYTAIHFLKIVGITLLMLYGLSAVTAGIGHILGFTKYSAKLNMYLSIFNKNAPVLLFTCFTAAITEELIFRAYMLPRLEMIFTNKYAAIIISSLLFACCHLSYGTFDEFTGTFFIGAGLAFQYQKYRNIKVVMICHFLFDLINLLVMIKIKHG